MIKSKPVILFLSIALLLSACVTAEQICNRGLGLILQEVELGNGQKIHEFVSEEIGETQMAVVYEGRDDLDICIVQFWQGGIKDGTLALMLDINMDSGHISAGDLGGEELMNLLMNAFIPLPK